MTDILHVLLGLALVNYFMLDVLAARSPLTLQAARLKTAVMLAGTTAAVFMVTALLGTLLEQWVLFRVSSSVVKTIAFIVILTAILHGAALLMVKRYLFAVPAPGIFLPLVLVTCVGMGLTLPVPETALTLPDMLLASFWRCAGFAVLLPGFTLLRERLAGTDIPAALRGMPSTMFAAALLSLTFMGFAGIA